MDDSGNYGTPVKLDAVNYIREKVDEWRESDYAGCSRVTRELLYHWRNETRSPRLFFCQIEAIETIIYLNEIKPQVLDKAPNFESDGGSFERQCAKMATGSGKTIVMGMLICWQILNHMCNKKKFTKNILVVSPSLIVLDRLQVLKPSDKNNIYDQFDLVPEQYRKLLSHVNIKITNWHKFKPKTKPDHASHELSRIKGESVKAFSRRLLGKSKNILVINDEGHHAWRPERYNKNKSDRTDREQAGIWTKGLDMLNNYSKITKCFDFSATPFVSTGKSIDNVFTWIVSDFSLDDAVESGLIKTPRSVHSDERNLEKYANIYRNADVKKAFGAGTLHADVKHAYALLGRDWKNVKERWDDMGAQTPPVMITVCNNTKHAGMVADEMRANSMGMPEELSDHSSILQIDSAVARRIEEGREKKQDHTLREKASTVGRLGEPGESINNIISVNMLTEGWDVKTVTHIMGLRAFTSQLLCEQVIGRGLRRTSYDVGADGLFHREHVTILGVPYGFLPPEDETESECKTCGNVPCICGVTPPKEIFVLEKRKNHQINWPIVSTVNDYTKYDWKISDKKFKPYRSSDHIPTDIEMAVIIDGRARLVAGELVSTGTHIQEVEFAILQSMFRNGLYEIWETRVNDIANSAPYKDVIGVLDMISEFLKTCIMSNLEGTNFTKSLFYQHDKIANHLLKRLSENKTSVLEPVISGYGSTGTRKSWFTKSMNTSDTKKTHLNKMIGSNKFELNIGSILDKNKNVLSWIKSDMVNFHIMYHNDETDTDHYYRPDFIVHLSDGVQLILEGKGEERPDVKYKNRAVKEWVSAMNNCREYGVWAFDTVYKKDGTVQWKTYLYDILKKDYPVECVCYNCNGAENGAKKASETFGVRNDDGILRYNNVCDKCIKAQYD